MDNINQDDCDVRCIHENQVLEAKSQMINEELIFDVADFYKVFSDSTRIKILYVLLNRELCVCDLVAILGMTQPAISHQLRVLRQNDLVKYRKDGKVVYYSLDDEHVALVLTQGLDHLLHKKNYEGANHGEFY